MGACTLLSRRRSKGAVTPMGSSVAHVCMAPTTCGVEQIYNYNRFSRSPYSNTEPRWPLCMFGPQHHALISPAVQAQQSAPDDTCDTCGTCNSTTQTRMYTNYTPSQRQPPFETPLGIRHSAPKPAAEVATSQTGSSQGSKAFAQHPVPAKPRP